MNNLDEKLAMLKEQAIDHLQKSGVNHIDHSRLDKLVNNLKLIIDNKDALLVSGSNQFELETVRKNFVVKKLGIKDKDKAMSGIHTVVDQMSAVKMKNRAAFYYLLQEKLN